MANTIKDLETRYGFFFLFLIWLVLESRNTDSQRRVNRLYMFVVFGSKFPDS